MRKVLGISEHLQVVQCSYQTFIEGVTCLLFSECV